MPWCWETNIFFGDGLSDLLASADAKSSGGTVFGYHVADPERYGVVDFDTDGRARRSLKSPWRCPHSNYAVTGLYFLDETAPDRARKVKPSARGELEIACLLEMYLEDWALAVKRMGTWLCLAGYRHTASLLDAGNFVRTPGTAPRPANRLP